MRSQPTYEGLKHQIDDCRNVCATGSQPTYEGLKPVRCPAHTHIPLRSQPTYEGLKPPRAAPAPPSSAFAFPAYL